MKMIKKILTVLLAMTMCMFPVSVQAQEQDLTPNATSSILIEASSKQVLHAKNEMEKLYPASTTKIMTMILLFEAINDNKISWDDIVSTSEYAASMGGSQVYLEPGEKMSVSDMFKAIAIASANDASVAIGEFIAGTIQGFVDMMNEKGEELGLVNTHFVNATGLHDDNHYTCALDLALMAAYLVDIGGEELLGVTSLYDSYIREDGNQSFWLVNTNKLLKLYDGVDGLKTGYTKEAKYCLVTTAQRDGLRLIGVVMQAEEPKVRNQEMTQLLDFGYNSYHQITLFNKDEVIDRLEINNSEKKDISIISKEDVVYIQNKSNEQEMKYEIIYDKTVPPISEGERVGTINVFLDDTVVASYGLYSNEDVGLLSFFEKTMRTLKDLF
jgi:D-Ala-D-Ala carboxypeptidase DacF. Serine peptidase. MEROPS family S11